MKRLILHIGSHKTGTTALQTWLRANAAALRKQGVTSYAKGNRANAHNHVGFIDRDHIMPFGFALRDPQAFQEEIAALEGETVIVSSENFSYFFQQEAIDEVAEVVAPLFDEVRILAYLRRQDRQAVSHHMEGARAARAPEWELWGHSQRALPPVNAFQPLYLNYDDRIGKWEKAFGASALMLRMYDRKHLVENDVIADVATQLGIDRTGLVPPEWPNEGLDRIRAKVGHMINEVVRDDGLNQTCLRSLPDSGVRLLPTRAQARAFLAPYRASNKALNDRLKITDLPWLFDESVDDLPTEVNDTWTTQEVDQMLRIVLQVLGRRNDPRALPAPEDLREAAILLAPSAPTRALRLVEAALVQRPGGRVLMGMRDELMEHLAVRPPDSEG